MLFFNCNIRIIFWVFNVSFGLTGRIIVFSRFIVVPVALFKVSKILSTFAADSWLFRNRLVSSAYLEILFAWFYFVFEYQLLIYLHLYLRLLLLLV